MILYLMMLLLTGGAGGHFDFQVVHLQKPHSTHAHMPYTPHAHTPPRPGMIQIRMLCSISMVFDRYGMLEHAEARQQYTALGHASVVNRVSDFKQAFTHAGDKGKDETDSPASLPDLVFMLFPAETKWFGDEDGQWVCAQ